MRGVGRRLGANAGEIGDRIRIRPLVLSAGSEMAPRRIKKAIIKKKDKKKRRRPKALNPPPSPEEAKAAKELAKEYPHKIAKKVDLSMALDLPAKGFNFADYNYHASQGPRPITVLEVIVRAMRNGELRLRAPLCLSHLSLSTLACSLYQCREESRQEGQGAEGAQGRGRGGRGRGGRGRGRGGRG